MTPYQTHCARWKDGCGSEQCPAVRRNTRVCLARGTLPCDVLLIGEAPGISENVRGRPFDGPAGNLLDSIVARAFDGVTLCAACLRGHKPAFEKPLGDDSTLPLSRRHTPGVVYKSCDDGHYEKESRPLRWAFTNLVGCLPCEEDGTKAGEPDDDQVRACAPRLQELVRIADPRLIVCVGRLAEDWLDEGYRHSVKLHRPIRRVGITHPAAILRANVAARGMMIQRCVVTLANAVEEL